MAFFTSQFINKTLASGVKELDEPLGLVNLNEIEQVFLQYKLHDLPEIITIADEDETLDLQTSDNELEGESIIVDKVIHQDL